MKEILSHLAMPVWAVTQKNQLGLANHAGQLSSEEHYRVAAWCPSMPPEQLGDPEFKQAYAIQYALYAGAMAAGIASEEMVVSMGKAGMLCSFGAGGLSLGRVEAAIINLQASLPNGNYILNLLHNHYDPMAEQQVVDLYLKHNIPILEASAFLDITLPLIQYRVSGLSSTPDGNIVISHRVIAKISRKEIAKRFLSPPSQSALARLLEQGKITPQQAELAARVPMADDITVEADSGGHTDNRPLVSALPAVIALRDEIQEQYGYAQNVRVGAGGGIATPESALAAFMMGAAYLVTGSINQSCLEAGTSEPVRKLLAQVETTDVAMAPAADMFELGARAQVLKRGTLFAARAQGLRDLYTRYSDLDEIPLLEKEKLEKQVFRKSLHEVWEETRLFFSERDPAQIVRAERDPHHKMALIFRWYLGRSARWAIDGEPGREMDYQIWTGPGMGAFNYWVRNTYLSDPNNRHVADVNLHILHGAAYLARIRILALQGVRLNPQLSSYIPKKPVL